jgi:hypothetical protein
MNLDPLKKPLFQSVICYITALALYGYSHGGGDQIEILPILKYWSDPTLFSHDFHIQFFSGKDLTERTPFLLLLYFTAGHSLAGVFILHALAGIALFYALLKIGSRITKDIDLAFISVILLIGLGPKTSLGGNEIYYASLIPSLPAKALGAWAILSWLNSRWVLTFSLLSLSAFVQPLVGAQLFLILIVTGILDHEERQKALIGALAFIPAMVFLSILFLNQSAGSITDQAYFDILEFRVGHHFFPSHFGAKDYVIFIVLLMASMPYLYKFHHRVFQFIALVITGALSYTLLVEVFPLTLALNTQWFKSTLWVEAFAIMAAIGWISQTLPGLNKTILATFAAGVILALMIRSNGLATSPLWKPKTDEIELLAASWAKENTPIDAIFFLPTTFTAFKYYSERSSYIDYKAMIHHHDYLGQWQERIEEVYGFKLDSKDKDGVLRKRMPIFPEAMESAGQDLYLISSEQNDDRRMELLKTLETPQDTLYIYHYKPDRN